MRPLLLALLLVASSCTPAPDDDRAIAQAAAAAPSLGPIACAAPLPGPPLAKGALEGDPDLAARFAAIDPMRAPDPVDFSAESRVTKMLAAYLLGRPAATEASHDDANAAGPLGRTLLAAAVPSPGRLDGKLLRYGLYATYLCSTPAPPSLEALVARYGDYRAWSSFDIDCSRAKDGPRRIYEDRAQGVYVAETLGPAKQVRETEVLFERLRGDAQLAFAVYTEAGALTDRSTFATGSGAHANLAAPFTCMTCHVDTNRGTFTRRMPVGTGAGCTDAPTRAAHGEPTEMWSLP